MESTILFKNIGTAVLAKAPKTAKKDKMKNSHLMPVRRFQNTLNVFLKLPFMDLKQKTPQSVEVMIRKILKSITSY